MAKRPLLINEDIEKKLKELDSKRRKYYLLADVILKNYDDPNKIVSAFLEKYKKCQEIILVEPNEKRLKVCSNYLDSDTLKPDNKRIMDNSFDLVFSIITFSIIIFWIKEFSSSGNFNFRKATLQEITFVGTYCYTNSDFEKTLSILSSNSLGKLEWIEYRELNKGADAFKEIHNGTCSAPKIILIP